jgi:hypothetical protein
MILVFPLVQPSGHGDQYETKRIQDFQHCRSLIIASMPLGPELPSIQAVPVFGAYAIQIAGKYTRPGRSGALRAPAKSVLSIGWNLGLKRTGRELHEANEELDDLVVRR